MTWLNSLLDTAGFPARWHCGNWTPLHGWLHVSADLLVFGAYAAIPVALVYFIRKRSDVPFLPILWLFAAFILACGFGHLVDATIFWAPRYRLLTGSKLITALVSWTTVIALVRVLPKALALHADLDRRVQDRTAELSAMLVEREVLLREVHHRVKNNLQMILSLINLQRRRVSDGAGEEALGLCASRVLAIAQVHELLYETKNASRIPLAAYVRGLVSGLDGGVGLLPKVNIETDVDDVMVSVESGVPCGLILNELLANAIKHAFPGERRGTISVSVRRSAPGELTLQVRDDGVGLPPDFDTRPGNSLGLSIVRRLASQLKGELTISREQGTTFRVSFPAQDLVLRGEGSAPPVSTNVRLEAALP
ncbi:MAG: sensor histidine kinase [Myxococcales bacterium]